MNPTPPRTDDTRCFPLGMAAENVAVRVVAIQGGAGMARRVAELGLRIGSELTVRQRLGAALVVASGPLRLALGTGMAHKILVSETGMNMEKRE